MASMFLSFCKSEKLMMRNTNSVCKCPPHYKQSEPVSLAEQLSLLHHSLLSSNRHLLPSLLLLQQVMCLCCEHEALIYEDVHKWSKQMQKHTLLYLKSNYVSCQSGTVPARGRRGASDPVGLWEELQWQARTADPTAKESPPLTSQPPQWSLGSVDTKTWHQHHSDTH